MTEDRRRSQLQITLTAIVTLAIVGVIAAGVVLVLSPDNGATQAGLLLGFLAPIIGALVAVQVRGTQNEIHGQVRGLGQGLDVMQSEVTGQVRELKTEVNGRMSQLLEQTSKIAHAEGVVEGAGVGDGAEVEARDGHVSHS